MSLVRSYRKSEECSGDIVTPSRSLPGCSFCCGRGSGFLAVFPGNIVNPQPVKRVAWCVDVSYPSALTLSVELGRLEGPLSLLRSALLEGTCRLFRTLDGGFVSHCRSIFESGNHELIPTIPRKVDKSTSVSDSNVVPSWKHPSVRSQEPQERSRTCLFLGGGYGACRHQRHLPED